MSLLSSLAGRVFQTDTWIMGHCNDGRGQRVVTVFEGAVHYDGVGRTSFDAEARLCAILRTVAEIAQTRKVTT